MRNVCKNNGSHFQGNIGYGYGHNLRNYRSWLQFFYTYAFYKNETIDDLTGKEQCELLHNN